MSVQNRLLTFGSAAGMLILILDSKTALSGASGGIDLCIRTLIPSLFPFFVLSVLLTGALSGQAGKYLRSIGTICKVPEGAESLIAVSILGGYPAGAQNVSVLFRRGQINASQAARLLAFCNNAGPAFIFSAVGLEVFGNKGCGAAVFISCIVFNTFLVPSSFILYTSVNFLDLALFNSSIAFF